LNDEGTAHGLQPAASSLRSSFRLGITGSFGSGKSAVAAMFADAGVAVIAADTLAREVVRPGRPALAEIAQVFGVDVLDADGTLNRRALSERVFADRTAMTRLNAIMHPRVHEARLERLAALGQTPLVVLDIALLFEAGRREAVDRVVVVTVSERQRFRRLARRGYNERQVMARLGMQWPQSRKAALADDVIDNSGDLDATRRQVQTLLQTLRKEMN
jgi:dephospho-CoA kinase